VDLDLPVDALSARHARHAVCEFLESVRVDRDGVMLAVSEAVTNAVLHAYRDGRPAGRVRVRADLGDDEVHVEVADDGMGMNPRPDSPGLGLGLPTIGAVADGVEIDDRAGGTVVRMRFALR
jgi:serine/threonine-protein kinase RsbW/stage II sporulation protein AB (anti-sigma F factor)